MALKRRKQCACLPLETWCAMHEAAPRMRTLLRRIAESLPTYPEIANHAIVKAVVREAAAVVADIKRRR